ncbi:MAG: hypothetical protein ABFS86_13095, partial [Planctomycetota bacterium]
MARRRGGRTSGGARGRRGHEEAVAVPVADDVLEFAEPERPARGGRRPSGGGAAGGPGIGMVIPLVVTLLAVLLIALGGYMSSKSGGKAVETALDSTAIAVAQSLASVEPSWWDPNHGTEKTIYEILSQKKDEKLKKEEAKNFADRDEGAIHQIKENFKALVETWGIKAPDAADQSKNNAIRSANTRRLARLTDIKGTAVLYAAILPPSGGSAIVKGGAKPDGMMVAGAREVGEATVQSARIGKTPARVVEYPIRDAFDEVAGRALVIVAAVGASGGGMATVAIFALLGLLLVGGASFGLCLAASKGLMNLGRSLDQIGRGDLDIKIRPGGGEVGAVARSADRAVKTFQKMQEQAYAAETTVQPVAAPVEASVDTASLLPQEPPRVDGYEFEAVHKPSPAGANDFFDYIQ